MSVNNLILLLTCIAVAAGTVYAQPPATLKPVDEAEARATDGLARAGFSLDAPSLIAAMLGKDILVAAHAITMAPRFGKEPGVVASLRSVMNGAQSRLAINAMMSLQKVGDTGWEPEARARFQNVRVPIERVHLGVVLAKAGYADGWSSVRSAILGRDFYFALEGLICVDPFDGLVDEGTGQRLDVVAELTAMRPQSLPELHSLLDIAVQRVGIARRR